MITDFVAVNFIAILLYDFFMWCEYKDLKYQSINKLKKINLFSIFPLTSFAGLFKVWKPCTEAFIFLRLKGDKSFIFEKVFQNTERESGLQSLTCLGFWRVSAHISCQDNLFISQLNYS